MQRQLFLGVPHSILIFGCKQVGSVYTPRDLVRGRRYLIEKGLGDIIPGSEEEVMRLLRSWEGEASEKKLVTLVGEEKVRKLKEMLNL